MFTKKFTAGDIIFNRIRNDQMLVINTNYSGYNVVRIGVITTRFFDDDIVKVLISEFGTPDITCPMFYNSQVVDTWYEKITSVDKSYLSTVINFIGDFLHGDISYDDYSSKWSYKAKNPKKATAPSASMTAIENYSTVDKEDNKTADKTTENVVDKPSAKPSSQSSQSSRRYTLIPINDAGVKREYTEDEVFTIANAPSMAIVRVMYPKIPENLVKKMYSEARKILGISKDTPRIDKWVSYFREGATKQDVITLIPSVKTDPKRLKSLDSAWRYWQKRDEGKYSFASFENSVKEAELKGRLQLAEAAESGTSEELSKVLKRSVPASFVRRLKKDIRLYLSKDIFYASFGAAAFRENFPQKLRNTDIKVYKTLIDVKPVWDSLPQSASEKYKLLASKICTTEENQILYILSTVFTNRFDNIDSCVKQILDSSAEHAEKVDRLQKIYLISRKKISKFITAYGKSPYAKATKT